MTFIIYQIRLFFRSPKIFRYKLQFLAEKLLRINRLTSIKLGKNRIIIPNSIQVLAILDEIFIRNIYKKIFWCDIVLDLGAYIGETALYLSERNKKVIAFEVANDNFTLIKKNCANKKNIVCIQKAVCGNSKVKNIIFTQDYDYSYNAGTEKDIQDIKKTYSVECDFIWNIIKRYKPDGIKMDIEGAEREILKYLIISRDFQTFKKGIIELHFRNDEDHKTYKTLIQYLNTNDYHYELFNNDWDTSKHDNKTRLLNIYFNKRDADR